MHQPRIPRCAQRHRNPAKAAQTFIGLQLLIACTTPMAQYKIDCEITYGGETQHISATTTSNPHNEPAHQIGSFFLFRVVWTSEPRDLAAIKIYTYADLDSGPALIHQQQWQQPQPENKGYFSGTNRVYEPLRDSELIYRCQFIDDSKGRSQ